MINLNELRDKAYKCACEHGFHDKEYSDEHYLMLVITEISEAVEADRKGKKVYADERSAYDLCQKNKFYKYAFENYIKGTIEEELADTVIRLLDLAGVRNIDLSDRFILQYVVSKRHSFIENIYKISKELIYYKYTLEEQINYVIRQIFQLAEMMNIDLYWHIEQKMKYNELRPKMHGKKY